MRLTLHLLFVFLSFAAVDAGAADINNYHFVLVTGYKSETLNGYMSENMRALHELGAEAVDQLRPPSETAVLDNVPFLFEKMQSFYRAGGNKPLVVIAHSKGGIEALQMLLRHADDVTASFIARVFLVQAPLQGAAYADHVLDVWDHSVYALTPAYWYYRSQHQGFLSMVSATVRQDFQASVARVPGSKLRELSSRVFYLRSKKPFENLPTHLKNSGEALASIGDNDGLVVTNDMLFADAPSFGHDLGVLKNFDHLDGFVLGDAPDDSRRARLKWFTALLANYALDADLVMKGSPLDQLAVP